MAVPEWHASACEKDEEGWIVAACSCGWSFGPVPDNETAMDVLMDHAREVGHAEVEAHHAKS